MNIKEAEIGLNELKSLTNQVNERYGLDFSHYAVSSFTRRIGRFMTIEKIYEFDAFLDKLISNKLFFQHFLEEVTVNTTEMFRSPSMWKLLRDDLFTRLEYKKKIRVWHAGCSSGEEVFSLCILLHELGIYDKVQIVATDINESVINKAKEGIYSMRSLELNSTNYIQAGGSSKFSEYYSFHADDSRYKMNTELIKNVRFYKHDLVKDKAFGKFDLILCRNVMIYFDRVLQDHVYTLFLESLKSMGILIIGSKESMVWSSTSGRYNVLSEKERIYQLKE